VVTREGSAHALLVALTHNDIGSVEADSGPNQPHYSNSSSSTLFVAAASEVPSSPDA
jgi:hypothetical protein